MIDLSVYAAGCAHTEKDLGRGRGRGKDTLSSLAPRALSVSLGTMAGWGDRVGGVMAMTHIYARTPFFCCWL
jgi:hypothetical protein